jgi:hypothetical protein
LDKLPKHLEAWKNPAAPPNNQVRIPFVSLTKLKFMPYWVLAQRCIGVIAPNVADFTADVVEETLARMKAEKDYKKATEDADIRKPEKLSDLANWTKFWDLLTTYLGRVKGAACSIDSTFVLSARARRCDPQMTRSRLRLSPGATHCNYGVEWVALRVRQLYFVRR